MDVIQVESLGLKNFLRIDFPGVGVLTDQYLPAIWGVQYYLYPVPISQLSVNSKGLIYHHFWKIQNEVKNPQLSALFPLYTCTLYQLIMQNKKMMLEPTPTCGRPGQCFLRNYWSTESTACPRSHSSQSNPRPRLPQLPCGDAAFAHSAIEVGWSKTRILKKSLNFPGMHLNPW